MHTWGRLGGRGANCSGSPRCCGGNCKGHWPCTTIEKGSFSIREGFPNGLVVTQRCWVSSSRNSWWQLAQMACQQQQKSHDCASGRQVTRAKRIGDWSQNLEFGVLGGSFHLLKGSFVSLTKDIDSPTRSPFSRSLETIGGWGIKSRKGQSNVQWD